MRLGWTLFLSDTHHIRIAAWLIIVVALLTIMEALPKNREALSQHSYNSYIISDMVATRQYPCEFITIQRYSILLTHVSAIQSFCQVEMNK